jgi:hypothetical protein
MVYGLSTMDLILPWTMDYRLWTKKSTPLQHPAPHPAKKLRGYANV